MIGAWAGSPGVCAFLCKCTRTVPAPLRLLHGPEYVPAVFLKHTCSHLPLPFTTSMSPCCHYTFPFACPYYDCVLSFRLQIQLLKRNFLDAYGVWWLPPMILQNCAFVLAATFAGLMYGGSYLVSVRVHVCLLGAW